MTTPLNIAARANDTTRIAAPAEAAAEPDSSPGP